MKNKGSFSSDWELSQDYYQIDQEKNEMKLEDFMEDDLAEVAAAANTDAIDSDLLQKTIGDVKQVMALSVQGHPIPQIARNLSLEEQYVYNILITAQGFHEDDQAAVAHLIMMG